MGFSLSHLSSASDVSMCRPNDYMQFSAQVEELAISERIKGNWFTFLLELDRMYACQT